MSLINCHCCGRIIQRLFMVRELCEDCRQEELDLQMEEEAEEEEELDDPQPEESDHVD